MMINTDESPWMSIAEVAERWGLKRETLLKKRRAGTLSLLFRRRGRDYVCLRDQFEIGEKAIRDEQRAAGEKLLAEARAKRIAARGPEL